VAGANRNHHLAGKICLAHCSRDGRPSWTKPASELHDALAKGAKPRLRAGKPTAADAGDAARPVTAANAHLLPRGDLSGPVKCIRPRERTSKPRFACANVTTSTRPVGCGLRRDSAACDERGAPHTKSWHLPWSWPDVARRGAGLSRSAASRAAAWALRGKAASTNSQRSCGMDRLVQDFRAAIPVLTERAHRGPPCGPLTFPRRSCLHPGTESAASSVR